MGRTALLAQLDHLLVEDCSDRLVVVTGGPGMGKSAVLAAWLARREAAGGAVPHHFLRRGWANWGDPEALVGSLVAQIAARFPDQREPEDDAGMHPAARMDAMLRRVSQRALVPRGERLVLLIDGLDEYDPPAGSPAASALGHDPLAAFLPYALPHGVSLLCASRPRHPHLDVLAMRGVLVTIDLDDAARFAADNAATVRAFWRQVAPELGLDTRFIDNAVERAAGNLQHAAMLRQHVAGLPPDQRRVEDIPRGLGALLAGAWERIATHQTIVDGLGILCAAREALTLDEIGAVAGWTGEPSRRTFLRGARELLIESQRAVGVREYQLQHESIRAHVAETIGAAALRMHHRPLGQTLARWPASAEVAARRYTLRHALLHRAEAGEWADAWRIAADTAFLEAKCREIGVHDAEADVTRTAVRYRAIEDQAHGNHFADLARALGRESHWLRAVPEATAALVWNRLRRSGWSVSELDARLRVVKGETFLRVRRVATRESQALVRNLEGHTDWVRACVVTSDGRHAISASDDETLKVWELTTGRTIATLEGHTHAVRACVVTLDGRYVISASRDKMLKVWELTTGHALATLQGHTGGVTACAVTPDGHHVVSASSDQTLKVWELATGRVLATLQGHTGGVTACAVTPDGHHVVSASDDQTLKIWELATGCVLATLQGHTGGVTACAMTPDGHHVVSASDDQTLRVWELATGRAVAALEGHTGRVTACAVSPEGEYVVSASDDQTLKVWELASGRARVTLQGHSDGVTACTVTSDGRYVVSASYDETLKIWELTTEREFAMLEGHTEQVTACVVTPDGRYMVSASLDGTLKIWELATGREFVTLEGHTELVRACVVTPDGRHVVSASLDPVLKVWELATGRALATLEGHTGTVTACAVTPDGRHVVSASRDRTLKVWDLATGRVIATLRGHTNGVNACAVTLDGRHVVSASDDHTLRVWDLATGHVLVMLEGHTDWVNACAVTLDGRHVVSASWDHTLKVWELATGRARATLEGHTSGVTACAVMPDGRYAISASDDQTLRVWDLTTYVCQITHCGDAAYRAVAATATTIVAGDAGGAVWFFDHPWSAHHRRSTEDRRHEHEFASHCGSEFVSPRSPMKHTILYVAANPLDTDRLALDEECAAIERELRMTSGRDDFDFRSKWAVSVDELMRHLNELQPAVLHFGGHGGASSTSFPGDGDLHRDVASAREAGIYLQEGRTTQYVSERALAKMIASAAPSTRLVVLNACCSAAIAESLRYEVDCVVGMDGSISDTAARSFAVAFYRALGHHRSVGNAVDQAAATLEAKHPGARPMCATRDGLHAEQIFL